MVKLGVEAFPLPRADPAVPAAAAAAAAVFAPAAAGLDPLVGVDGVVLSDADLG